MTLPNTSGAIIRKVRRNRLIRISDQTGRPPDSRRQAPSGMNT